MWKRVSEFEKQEIAKELAKNKTNRLLKSDLCIGALCGLALNGLAIMFLFGGRKGSPYKYVPALNDILNRLMLSIPLSILIIGAVLIGVLAYRRNGSIEKRAKNEYKSMFRSNSKLCLKCNKVFDNSFDKCADCGERLENSSDYIWKD